VILGGRRDRFHRQLPALRIDGNDGVRTLVRINSQSDHGPVFEPAPADRGHPTKVHRDGIHCHGLRYLALTLTAYVGEEVTVRYDPRDLAEIRVFYRNEFLCVAVSPELAAASISLKDLQTARNRRRRELHSELTNRRSLVDALTHPVREVVPAGAATIQRPDAADDEPPTKARLKLYAADDE
jgi:putative transposase